MTELRTRNAAVIGNKDFDLTYLQEAYTTEYIMLRNRMSSIDPLKGADRTVAPNNFVSRKNVKRKCGYIKSRPIVVKGKRSSLPPEF